MWFQVLENQNTLVQIQPTMKADLLSAVQSFQGRVQSFYTDYNNRYLHQWETDMMMHE